MKKIFLLCILILSSQLLIGAAPYDSYNYGPVRRELYPMLTAVTPVKSFTGVDLGADSLNKPNDFRFGLDGRVYIADTGNNRILILNEDLTLLRVIDGFDNAGEWDTFSSPEGVFAEEDGSVFIADTQNGRIVVLSNEGELITLMDKVALTGSSLNFRPQKVAVDMAGRIYVVSGGSTEGLIQLTDEGEFVRFFGSNRVSPNPMEVIYRKFLTRNQKQAREQFIPTEFSNVQLDSEGFLYVTTRNVKNNQIKRLNAVGSDVLKHDGVGDNIYGDLSMSQANYNRTAQFQSVDSDKDGNIYALDNASGKIFVYDSSGQFLFMFGGKGDQLGMFMNAQAIAERNGTIYVCDSTRGVITMFRLTSFGAKILEANHLYLLGEFEKSLVPWTEITRMDAGYTIAWRALGQTYFGRKEYSKAMEYYKLGFDKKGYSKAFGQIRDKWIRDNFALLALGLTLSITAITVNSKVKRSRRRKTA